MAATRQLWKEIQERRKKSGNGKSFLTASDFRTICTKDLISSAIAELACLEHERIGLAAKVYEDGLTIFAILIWMKRESSVVDFRNHDAMDARLPLHEEQAVKIAPEFGRTFAREVQWQFLPYTFKSDMCDYHRIIDSNMVFPFLKEEPLNEGGFGEISKVTVVSSEQELLPYEGPEVQIVRKRLKRLPFHKSGSQDHSFQEEVACLTLLHRLKHANIVPLLGSYTYNEEHNLLFPCLDMDLSTFLQCDARYGEFKWNLTFVSALHGLASALQNVHELRLQAADHGIDLTAIGYHHDLRPPNILVTRNTFMLTDFSLAKIKSPQASSQTMWKAGTGDYIAPECMGEDFSNLKVGRAIDLWAFACLIMEVVAYMEQGTTGLEQFRSQRLSSTKFPNWQDRQFFDSSGIKPIVLQWMQAILLTSKSELVGDLIKLASNVLKIEPDTRPTAAQICANLRNLDIKFHLQAVQGAFREFFHLTQMRMGDEPLLMDLWCEAARFNAIGKVFGLSSGPADGFPIEDMRSFCEGAINYLRPLLSTLRDKIEREKDSSLESKILLNMREPLSEKVQIWVQGLIELLPRKIQNRVEMIWEQSSLNTTDIVRLNQVGAYYHHASHHRYDRISTLVAMKSIRLQFLQGLIKNLPGEKLVQEKLEFLTTSSEHHIATYQKDSQVLVEWVSFSPTNSAVPTTQRRLLMELKSQGFGIKTKPSGLRTLDCIGVIDDGTQSQVYGFLYAFPEPYSKPDSGLPVSLCTLLYEDIDRDSINMQPLLGAKFRLASALAIFVKELHLVGWLHEDINSQNIIFFGTSSDLSSCSEVISNPYIVGLQKSRPDTNMWYTDGPSDEKTTIYHHPKYKKHSRFISAYDYYSLGLVLLEIGLWTPLKSWSDKYEAASPKELRTILLRTYVPRLGQKMGASYRDIVTTCLSGELEDIVQSPSIGEDQRVLTQYLQKVVEPLDELVRILI